MWQFWRRGYHATSISDLVDASGVSRHGLYAEFGDKRGALFAALEHYRNEVVSPAFAPVECDGAGVAEIRRYFEAQISLARDVGLPGPGCLIANTMTEAAPHDAELAAFVTAHLDRLAHGFEVVIRRHLATGNGYLDPRRYGRFLAISSQGLWSVSRLVSDASQLHAFVDQLLEPLEVNA